jgi:AI-2 transport protein TqsA
MNTFTQNSPVLRVLMGAACCVIILAGMKAIAPLLNMVLLAWLIAYSITPLPNWLMRKRVPSALAVLFTLLLVVIGGLTVASLLGLSIAGLIQKLPTYQADLTSLRDSVIAFFSSRGFDLSQIKSLDIFSPNRLIQLTSSVLGGLGQLVGNTLILIFLVAIFLFEFAATQEGAANGHKPPVSVLSRMQTASHDVKRYVAIVGGTGLIQAIAMVVLLQILGVDFAVTWGVLFFLLNFIPAVGFLLALIPPAIVGFLQSGWVTVLFVVIGYWAINFVGDNILKPKFLKKGLDVSILVILLSLLFWNWVLGAVGAILAVPLTLAIKNLFEQIAAEPSPPATGFGPAANPPLRPEDSVRKA